MDSIKKLYVVFKTHLDIGFTDFAANIKNKYLKNYIPAALKTAKELRESGGDARFVWATGSWLIYEYVKTLNAAQLKDFKAQVDAGDIRWHAFPFTTHTELMDKELFEAGIGLSKELDKLFGVKTISAKMTDVPGHTRAIVPVLQKYGIEFMHIGVNPASSVPDVPDIFRWLAPTGEAVTVMYHKNYGECSALGNTGAAVYFAHAGDNLSPPAANDIKKLFKELHKKYPEAEIIASDLNLPALELRKEINNLPVVTAEIGDTWIHGAGTDPAKISMFRSLLRFRETLSNKDVRNEFNKKLLLIPEHTCGLDEKTHLKDYTNFSKADFNRARTTAAFKKMEKSWAEQRAYLSEAISVLPKQECEKATLLVKEYKRPSVLINGNNYQELPLNSVIKSGNAEFSFNKSGAINHLTVNGKIFADARHNFAKWSYTQFGPEDYKKYFAAFIRLNEEWVLEDYSKIGMEKAVEKRHNYSPQLKKLLKHGNAVTAVIQFPGEAIQKYGCPKLIETTVEFCGNKMYIDAAWFNKDANRCAEMMNLGFDSFEKDISVSKLGEYIKPEFIKFSNHNLHATDNGIKYPHLSIKPLDSALVSFGKPAVLDFQNKTFNTSKVWFNLYNNQWGTNFPMWYDEDARFRFEISFF